MRNCERFCDESPIFQSDLHFRHRFKHKLVGVFKLELVINVDLTLQNLFCVVAKERTCEVAPLLNLLLPFREVLCHFLYVIFLRQMLAECVQ